MGPLTGLKVIEIKGIGPGPYAGMLLADLGAEVIVVERSRQPSGIAIPSARDIHARGKRSITLNLKTADGLDTLLGLVERADVLFEGFRPGVAERLGFGPEVCLQRNARLIYGRVTGWGQTGPLSKVAGHDINYISISGALAAIGGADKPTPPLNLVGDYAGGSLFLVMGILAALYDVGRSGKGQVIDAAITDGTANLMSLFHTLGSVGQWSTHRNSNFLDGAAHFYDVYETSDGKYISLGAIEPQFYSTFVERAQLDPAGFSEQNNPAMWPEMKEKLKKIFGTKTRAQWCKIMEGTDACFAPVLDYLEAAQHPHNKFRNTFIEINGLVQPAPAPVFGRTVCGMPSAPRPEGADTEQVLVDWGFSRSTIEELKTAGAIPQSDTEGLPADWKTLSP